MSSHSITIQSYRNNFNLGDAIQSLAIQRLIKVPYSYKYRDDWKEDDLHICNGWLGDDWNPYVEEYIKDKFPFSYANIIMSGVFFNGNRSIKHAKGLNTIIGARDPYTYNRLKELNIRSELVGCATLTLPRYYGPRSGVIGVDYKNDDIDIYISHMIQGRSWDEELDAANAFIRSYSYAEHVITNRLHVLYPCLAFGTPVTCYFDESDPRFSFAVEMLGIRSGFKYTPEMIVMPSIHSDIESLSYYVKHWANKYINFLNARLEEKLIA